MKSFFNYYKWHLFFFALFVTCIVVFTLSSCTKSLPDLKINCVSTGYINTQTFYERNGDLEEMLHDADGDGEKYAQLNSFTYDVQSDLDDIFEALCTEIESDIIISTKETFERFENKDMFDTSTNYVVAAGTDKYETLKDENGRIYAVSIEGNEYLESFGFLDTTGLYLAVVTGEADAPNDTLSSNKKNARNIAQVIIRERDV